MFRQIAIVAAMEGELGFLRRAMSPPDQTGAKCITGRIGSKTVTVVRSGVGPLSTAGRLAEIPEPGEFDCVLSIGCAGALSPSLNIGDVVISEKIVDDTSPGSSYLPAAELVSIAKNCCEEYGFTAHSGTTVSTSEVAATVEAKEGLAEKCGAIAVDMETAQVAVWAARLGLPMLAMRTISDTSVDRIPPEIGEIVDRKGKLRPARAISLFARKPGLAFEAARLKRNLDSSLGTLGKVVLALLDRI